jgi:hypothetical protein
MKLKLHKLISVIIKCGYVHKVSGNGNDFGDEYNSDKMTLIC